MQWIFEADFEVCLALVPRKLHQFHSLKAALTAYPYGWPRRRRRRRRLENYNSQDDAGKPGSRHLVL